MISFARPFRNYIQMLPGRLLVAETRWSFRRRGTKLARIIAKAQDDSTPHDQNWYLEHLVSFEKATV
jgi:hypothetical protein